MLKKLFVYACLFLLFIGLFFYYQQVKKNSQDQKTVFLAILPNSESYYLKKNLDHIEALEYDKKLITIYFSCKDEECLRIAENWQNDNEKKYRKIMVEDITNTPLSINDIKNKSLQKALEEHLDFYFSIDSNTFIAPFTLKELIGKDKPIISPLLHAIPEPNDRFSNFFSGVTEFGFYKEHSGYNSILFRTIKGTFKVPLIRNVYLIKTDYLNDLNFGKTGEDSAIAFSNQARMKNIPQYISNENTYGVFIRYSDDIPEKEKERRFKIMSSYLNCNQEQEKKIIYMKTGHWGDIFALDSPIYNKDCWKDLRLAAQAAGFELKQTPILSNLQGFEKLVIFEIFDEEMPYYNGYPKEKLISILWEPPSVIKNNYIAKNHKQFSRVYTYRDDLVDNKKYFKIYYPDLRSFNQNPIDFSQKKFATLIAANKQSPHRNELYSSRARAVNFYESNHPEDLDLYGPGWPPFKVYKGIIPKDFKNRIETLKQYKFCYCYENIKNVPGYISEKIFNVFEAGCIPIYWGASNVNDFIPKNCYISRSDFTSDEELYTFLKGITREEYLQYLENINNYLNSDQAKLFSIEHFIEIFMNMLNEG